jgi:hypothetical protein
VDVKERDVSWVAIDWRVVAAERGGELRARGAASQVEFAQVEVDRLVALSLRRDAARALLHAQRLWWGASG